MKSARSARYFAAGRLDSRPCITTVPWTMLTLQVHFPRLCRAKAISKIGNSGLAIPAVLVSHLNGVEPGGAACVFTPLGEERRMAHGKVNPIRQDRSALQS